MARIDFTATGEVKSGGLGLRTLLLIEDNEIEREMLEKILGGDYDLLTASNGVEGLNLLRFYRTRVSAVLLDLEMPVMDGYDFLKEYRQDVSIRNIPVIVTTMKSNPEEEARCLELGASDFLPKPYNPQLTHARIKNQIRIHETSSALHELETDHLTGLYQKQAFYRRAQERIAKNPDADYAVLAMDIENFTFANAQYGEARCDEFLSYLGKFLREHLTTGIACRFGGDQFVVLYEVKDLKKPLPKELEADYFLEKPPIPRQMIKRGIYSPIDPEVSVARCCDRAFMAVRKVKGIYGKNIGYYDENMGRQLQNEQQILEDMETALAEEQFVVFYQPKHDSKTGKVVGAEALVRWLHPEYGFMMPGLFIPLFEKNGFISRVDSYVIEQVCRDMKRWKREGIPMVPVSVNVSRRDCFEDAWIGHQLTVIDRYGVDHSLIHFEVTESLYAEYTDLIVDQMKRVQDLGFEIEMDDFGAGYSSLGLLSIFPLNIIKLDISFVRKLDTNEIVIENVINLAHRMGFRTVAEGVEDERAFGILRDLGCDYIQGYYFSKPLTCVEFEMYVQRRFDLAPAVGQGAVSTRKLSEVTDELELKNALLDCLNALLGAGDAMAGVEGMLAQIGSFYSAERVRVFEITQDGLYTDNTFEWCRESVVPEKDSLRHMEVSLIRGWIEAFEGEDAFVLLSVAEIRDTQPGLYNILAAQSIERLMAVPFRKDGTIVGVLGVDNPGAHMDAPKLLKCSADGLFKILSTARHTQHLTNRLDCLEKGGE